MVNNLIKKFITRKILIGLILVILITLIVIIWAFWIKPEDNELIIEEPSEDGSSIEEKPSCFDSNQDPIPICNCEDLQKIEQDLSANYKLENDINCSQTKNWNDGKGFNSLALGQPVPFSGTFDGQSHIIFNLFINRPDQNSIGLFSYSKGEIINLGLKGAEITGKDNTGILVGSNFGGKVINSYVLGSIFGNDDIGGLVGRNEKDSEVINCYASVTVFNGGKDTGGLVGENEGIILNSYATGSVSSQKGTGGLAGENEGIIRDSYARGNVIGDENVGGFVGDNEGTITNCYATGIISGNKDVGGFIGDNHGGTVENSFSTGNVIGFDRIGGFNGVNHSGNIINCYWNKQPGSLLSESGSIKQGIVECSIIENNEQYFYDTNNAPMNLWEFPPWTKANNGKGYPVLSSEEFVEPPGEEEEEEEPPPPPPPPGEEEEEEEEEGIISIYNCEDLQAIQQDLSADYKLANNIDCSNTQNWNNGKGFNPLGRDLDPLVEDHQGEKFTGDFDGQGYIISNLFISRPNEDYIGLFGISEREITDLGLENFNITGRDEAGVLTGDNNGTIAESYATGDLTGSKTVGGLVGDNDGTIINCYTNVYIFDALDENIGGLVGDNEGIIENSHAIGDVSGGKKDVGGLVGDNHTGVIKNSYATGEVVTIKNGGGFIGNNHEGSIENSYAIGNISGVKDVGGFIGDNHGGTVENSFSTGEVSGTERIGGFIGVNHGGLVTNAYAHRLTGNLPNCVGEINSGVVECNTIQNNKSYFYNLGKAPMNVWKFPPWSRSNDGKDYPVLE